MQIFYAPDISGDNYILDEKESRHTVRVLRMKEGSAVNLIDGKGGFYEGIITDADPKKCVIWINSAIPGFEKRKYHLHLGISPLKNPERFEWFVEKCVEIGVDEITPIICQNSEKQGIKADRINSIIISAMKQSLKARKTELNPVCSFDDLINKETGGTKMIATCNTVVERHKIADVYNPGDSSIILIGPEGDFSKTEVSKAITRGFIPVHLGASRLRTETAGVAACHSVYLLNQ